MRKLFWLILLDVFLLVGIGYGIWVDNALYRGITYLPDPNSTPIPWADGPEVGVNLYHLHLEVDPVAVTRTLHLARDLGVRYLRMQLPWEDVEIHGWGDFEDRRHVETQGVISAWEKYDRIVALANALNLELILRIDRPPDWARERARHHPKFIEGLARDHNSTGPPDTLSDYSAFVNTVVRRYRGKVRFFQIWNEPNLKNEWNWQDPSPEEFAELLRFGYAAAKAANPDAVVIFPSLAPVDGLDERAPMTEMEYLDRVYRAGAKEYFDILSVQAYGLGQPPQEHRYVRLRPFDHWSWLRPIDTRTDVSRLVLIREVMELHGDAHKAMWISEMGWNSAPATIPEDRRYTWGRPVSEEQKADYLIGMIERARDEWPAVGVMNIWTLRHGGYAEPDPADPTPYFAIVGRDWSLLPAYTRLQAYLKQPPVLGVGVHRWQHPALRPVADGWQVQFRGSQITVVGSPALAPDALRILSVDGNPVTPSQVIHTTLQNGEPAIRLASLPDRIHTVVIATSSDALPDRVVVARDPPFPEWFWMLLSTVVPGLFLLSSALTVETFFVLTLERR